MPQTTFINRRQTRTPLIKKRLIDQNRTNIISTTHGFQVKEPSTRYNQGNTQKGKEVSHHDNSSNHLDEVAIFLANSRKSVGQVTKKHLFPYWQFTRNADVLDRFESSNYIGNIMMTCIGVKDNIRSNCWCIYCTHIAKKKTVKQQRNISYNAIHNVCVSEKTKHIVKHFFKKTYNFFYHHIFK